jgi:anti-sigma factor RsiW
LDVALDHESGPLCAQELKLPDFIDGHLPSDESEELADHLPDCETCQTKLRAFEELTDLKAVMVSAVPEPPAWLTIETMEHQERTAPTNGTATLAEPGRRTPAVRPLAACCAALLIIGLIGVFLIRPSKATSDPASTNGPQAILPQLSDTSANGGLVGASSNLPAGAATTITVTTTSVPAVTFPTIPAPGAKKGKP